MLALCREQRLEHRTKHIALRYFLPRELQQRGQLRLAYVASEANTADVFTKALAPCDHQRCCTQLGLDRKQGETVSGLEERKELQGPEGHSQVETTAAKAAAAAAAAAVAAPATAAPAPASPAPTAHTPRAPADEASGNSSGSGGEVG
ncbi:unnamed protein product [Closterium sp. NIES-54]